MDTQPLLSVIPPGRTPVLGELVVLGTQQEEEDRSRANVYLNRIANRLRESSVEANTAVVVHDSIASAIVAYANRNSVDLISMFTHDRRGLAKLVKGSVAREVERRAVMPVRVFRPEDIAAGVAKAAQSPTEDFDYSTVDVFARLSREQIASVVALGNRVSVTEGDTLGAGGEAGQNLFIIHSGEAQLTAQSEIGQIAVRLAGPGESFPQAVLLGEGNPDHGRIRLERYDAAADSSIQAAGPLHPGRSHRPGNLCCHRPALCQSLQPHVDAVGNERNQGNAADNEES